MKYKSVTVSDYRKHLSKHFKSMREGEVLEVDGLLLTDLKNLMGGPTAQEVQDYLESTKDVHVEGSGVITLKGEEYRNAELPRLADKQKAFEQLKAQLDGKDVRSSTPAKPFTLDGLKVTARVWPPEQYEAAWHCEKCKKPAECRKMFEEGVEYVICEACALKAKLNWNKLEKL